MEELIDDLIKEEEFPGAGQWLAAARQRIKSEGYLGCQLTAKLVAHFASLVANSIMDQLGASNGRREEVRALGHKVLLRIYELARQLGLDLERDSVDYPLTSIEALFRTCPRQEKIQKPKAEVVG